MKTSKTSGTAFVRLFRPSRRLLASALGCIALVGVCQSSVANEYVPSGLYDAEQLVLDNGLRVIMKPRANAHTVSIRLAVDVGHWDFPCGRQQTAHFLEHLLFSGTTDREESELDNLIETHGGEWNATTRREETVYEIDIFSRYADLALDTLYDIMTKTEISYADVYLAREIVHREMGGKPSAARRWLYQLGIGKSAWSKAWEMLGAGSNAGCPDIESADAIFRHHILSAYETYYVPGNMVLVVVGEFDPGHMLRRIRTTFGRIPAGATPERARARFRSSDRRIAVNSHFSPILDSDALVVLAFRVPDRTSPDRYALQVLEGYLDQHVYDVLRVNRGFAYAPGTLHVPMRNFGLMLTYADVYVENMDDAVEAMQVQIDSILKGELEEDDLEEIKRGLLLSEARKYERNADIAAFYVDERHSVTPKGKVVNVAERISAVTTDDLGRVAREYMHLDQGVVLRIAPTFTYSELVLWLGGFLLTAFVWSIYKRKLRAKRRRADVALRDPGPRSRSRARRSR